MDGAKTEQERPHDHRDEAAVIMGHPGRVNSTQSFVHTLSATWTRPGLTLREVAWRWAYGIPAAALLVFSLRKALLPATAGTMDPAQLGLDKALLNDPIGALTANTVGTSAKFGLAFSDVFAYFLPTALWLIPVLLIAYVVISALGRNWVARAADPTLKPRLLTLMALQGMRTFTLLATFLVWFFIMARSAGAMVTDPLSVKGEPNLVGFSATVIIVSLLFFTGWAAVNWVFSVAPLLAMLHGLGVWGSLRASFQLGTLRGKLVEVNLVLGIVKIALVVLAMVFSATPLPFESVTSRAFLAWWWAAITLIYLVWSDFFHVARLLAYLQLWRSVGDEKPAK